MISSIAVALLTAVALALGVDSAAGASFTVDEAPTAGSDSKNGQVTTTIRISADIVDGDAERLRAILTSVTGPAGPGGRARGRIVAELSSNGGDIYAGLNMGYLFKEFDVATRVRAGDLCLSACALAFLGGTASHLPPNHVAARSIDIGGQVAFHSFYINPQSRSLAGATDASSGLVIGFALARGGSALLVRYAAAMSLDPAFIGRLLSRPSEIWEFIDVDGEFVDLTTCATGLDRPRISPAEVAANICNHATGDFSPVGASQAREMTAPQARRNLLEHVQANIAGLGLQGPLARQLVAAVASRDDRQMEVVYDDLRRVGVPVPEIVGPVFEVTGYATGDYNMQCHVSYSLQNPDRHDVAIQGPSGLTKAFKYAPKQCGRLFQFDRNDMVNPQRK